MTCVVCKKRIPKKAARTYVTELKKDGGRWRRRTACWDCRGERFDAWIERNLPKLEMTI